MPTKIPWCEETWNPQTGCQEISPGCANCYARRMAGRLRGRFGYPADYPFAPTYHLDKLDEPRKWKNPRLVFVCSMGDLFHPGVYPAIQEKIFQVITETPKHTYLILTKRPDNMRKFLAKRSGAPENCYLGVSIEDQIRADYRIKKLLRIPGARRFVSAEPLLAPIDIEGSIYRAGWFPESEGTGLSWVIVGCESGPGRRPMREDWARIVKGFCVSYRIPFFYKQAEVAGKVTETPELDGKAWTQYPWTKIKKWL
jgi:protein gp37